MADTILANTSTSAQLAVGDSIFSEIDSVGDEDWFAVSLQAGQTYQIDLEGSSTSVGTLFDALIAGIHDSNANMLSNTTNDDGGVLLNSLLQFTAPSTGIFYIAAAGAFGATGTYRLSLTIPQSGAADDFGASTSSAGQVSIGGSVTGEIEQAGDEDWFGVSLQAGQSYQIDLEGSPTSAGTLSDALIAGVYDSSANMLSNTTNDDGGVSLNSLLRFTAPSTGTFYIAAAGIFGSTGSYTLSVATAQAAANDDFGATTSSAGQVSTDGSVIGEIEQAGDEDWFAVTLQAGQSYQIDLEGSPTSAGTLSDALIAGVYDSSANLLSNTTNDDGGVSLNSLLRFTAPSTGTFYVAASGFGGSIGTYLLSVVGSRTTDDFGASTSSAGQVSAGGSVIGEIEQAGDEDWFGVSLQAGQSYQIDLEGSPTSAGTLFDTFIKGVYDSAGELLSGTDNDDGGVLLNSLLEFTAPSTDTFYIATGSALDTTGTYRLSVTELQANDDFGVTTSSAGQVITGGSATGEIEQSGDEDWFAVSLVEGQFYQIALEGSPTSAGTLSDTFLRGIHNSEGKLLSGTTDDDSGDSSNSLLEFVAPSTGTFYISAGAFGSSTGTYRLSVSASGFGDDFGESINGAGQLTVGGSVTGEIEQSGDEDWFAVSLQAGQTYQIDLEGSPTSQGTLSDTFLRGVYDNSGQLLSGTADDDSGTSNNSLLQFVAPTTDRFYISAGAFGRGTGTYRLSVSAAVLDDDFGATINSAGDIAVGGSVTGEIEQSADEDWFAISLEAGRSYQIDLEGSPTAAGTLSDTFLRGIHDSEAKLLPNTTNDDGGNAANSSIEFTAPTSGIHYISAGAFGGRTGTYTLSVSDLGAGDDYGESITTAGAISVGGSTSGEIERSSDRDWFAVSLLEGQSYRIDLEGSPTSAGTLSDTFLRGIYDKEGKFITNTSNDDNGTSTNSSLQFVAPSTGTHYISAGAYSDGTGTYTLSVSDIGSSDDFGETVASAGTVSVDGSTNGEIEAVDDHDWFAVSLTAGQTYQFDLEGNSTSAGTLPDPILQGIFDASGNLISNTTNDDGGSGFNSRLEYTATNTGTHFVSAGAFGSTTGSYRISVSDLGSGDDFSADVFTAASINVGGSISAAIEQPNDRDWFAVSLQAGQTYRLDLEGSPTDAGTLSDTILQGIFDASGNLISNTTNDDGGTGRNSSLQFTPSITGAHYISAGAFGSNVGTYKLSISNIVISVDDFGNTVATAGTVSVDGSTNGEVEQASDIDWFGVNLQAGQTYQINLEGSPTSAGTLADTFLNGVFDASGNMISETTRDNGGIGDNSLLEFTATSTGTHYVSAGAFGEGTGTYKLSVLLPPELVDDYGDTVSTAGTISLGNSKTAELEVTNDRDWFAINLEAGHRYQIDLEGSSTSAGTLNDPILEGIFDSGGNLIANTHDDDGGVSHNSQLEFTATASGTHYISATAFSVGTLGTGTYTATIIDTTPAPGAGAFDITINYDGDPQFQPFFDAAAARWEEIIIGDLPDIILEGQLIDDLVIEANVVFIDGVGTILGLAMFTRTRPDGNLPTRGFMEFDLADMSNMLDKGILQDVILHEMGHVLGISSLGFRIHHLNNELDYIGSNALVAYRLLTGDQSLTSVPLENGNSGTRGAHWEEDVFDRELMTGTSENSPPMPLSIVTIGALQDLGYLVDAAQADTFTLIAGSSLSLPLAIRSGAEFSLQSENPDVSTHSSQAILNFSGSKFTFSESKPLVLNTETNIQKLEGNIVSSNESTILFFETTTGFNQLVRLDGEFEKNSPATTQDIKGAVSKISFLSEVTLTPTALEYKDPVDVQVVINNWHNNFLAGDNFIEVLSFDPSDDIVDAGSGNDIVALGAGNDTLNGGEGIDVAVFQQNAADYDITNSGEGLVVAGPVADGTDSLTGVERLQFADKSVAFDLDGNAGNAAKLLGAVVGADAVANEEYVGIALSILDSGTSYESLMQLALDAVLGPMPTSDAVITLFHTTLLGEAPSAATLAEFAPLIDSGEFTPASLGVLAAEHEINQSNIDLIGLAQSGIEYLPVA